MIITNNCDSAFLYKNFTNIPYPHPFIWNIITYDNFLTLANNFNNIDFNDISIGYEKLPYPYNTTYYKDKYFCVYLNNINIPIYYVHYNENEKYVNKDIFIRRANRIHNNSNIFIYIKLYHLNDNSPEISDCDNIKIISKTLYSELFESNNFPNHSKISEFLYNNYKSFI